MNKNGNPQVIGADHQPAQHQSHQKRKGQLDIVHVEHSEQQRGTHDCKAVAVFAQLGENDTPEGELFHQCRYNGNADDIENGGQNRIRFRAFRESGVVAHFIEKGHHDIGGNIGKHAEPYAKQHTKHCGTDTHFFKTERIIDWELHQREAQQEGQHHGNDINHTVEQIVHGGR